MNAIETVSLTKSYGRHVAVRGIDLVVPEGACAVLVGANGAGKSTTLQMLMNLVAPTSGEAIVLGRRSQTLRGEVFQHIGYASESQELPPISTTQFFNYLRGLYPKWDKGLEQETRDRLKVSDKRSLRSLSRGERMKACIAAALPFAPELVVMDEPLGGLDPVSRAAVVDLLIDRAPHTTMLISSHDIADLEGLATHVAVMHAGRLILQDEVEAILSRFRSVNVRGLSSKIQPSTDWLGVQAQDDHMRFVHSRFTETSLAEIHSVVGPEARIDVSGLSLSAVLTAMMRSAEESSTP
ncbi:MAG: ABC transporter ATP-binding protein [Phenylobacterium sp.]|nr:ABC transporter ATP-binding protein [Phenylobacterium sp.]MCA3716131.1 ABC transporter ATP-binding protein [Phenylobacterium sp.]